MHSVRWSTNIFLKSNSAVLEGLRVLPKFKNCLGFTTITIRGIYEMSKILKNHKTWTKYEKLKISENYDIKKMYLFWQVIFLRIKWLVLYNVKSKLKQFVLNIGIFALSQVIKQSISNSISFFLGSTYWT